MGTFRIEIQAVGGHGCERETKDGAVVKGCGQPTCPDCMTREFVNKLRQSQSVESAKLIHWPGQPNSVQDDLLTGVRSGSF